MFRWAFLLWLSLLALGDTTRVSLMAAHPMVIGVQTISSTEYSSARDLGIMEMTTVGGAIMDGDTASVGIVTTTVVGTQIIVGTIATMTGVGAMIETEAMTVTIGTVTK